MSASSTALRSPGQHLATQTTRGRRTLVEVNPFHPFHKIVRVYRYYETGALNVVIQLKGNSESDPRVHGIMWGVICFGDGTTHFLRGIHFLPVQNSGRRSYGRRAGPRQFIAAIANDGIERMRSNPLLPRTVDLYCGGYRWTRYEWEIPDHLPPLPEHIWQKLL